MEKVLRCDEVQRMVKEIIHKILASESNNMKEEEIFSSARCMSYLYLEIFKNFDIKIPEAFIIQHKFNSIESICDMISEQMQTAKSQYPSWIQANKRI